MKIFARGTDGGPKSTVIGYWLVEIKRLFSLALLRFADGSRHEYHSHAFHSISWLIRGRLREEHLSGREVVYRPSWRPFVTRRETFHRVISEGTSWVLTVRGPWARIWHEYDPTTHKISTLGHGRVIQPPDTRP